MKLAESTHLEAPAVFRWALALLNYRNALQTENSAEDGIAEATEKWWEDLLWYRAASGSQDWSKSCKKKKAAVDLLKFLFCPSGADSYIGLAR